MSAAVDGEYELYCQEGMRTKVTLRDSHISMIEQKYVKGTGVRAVIDGFEGFAYTTDKNRVEETMNLATRLARASSQMKKVPLPEPYPHVEVHFASLEAVDAGRIAEMAENMLQGATEKGGQVVFGSIEILELLHTIDTTYGIEGEYKETLLCAAADVKVGNSFGTETLYSRTADDLYCVGEGAAKLAEASRDPQSIEGGMMHVILRPPALGKMLESALVPSFLGDNIEKGSLFKNRIGETVSKLTIIDDGTLKEGVGSRPFDGEGSPCRRTILMEDGILKSFLHDTTTAYLHGTKSTGNAMRASFCSPPCVYVSNFVVMPQQRTTDLIENTPSGILVNDAVGSFSFDFTTGVFGFEAKNVFLIEKGNIGNPVSDVTITGKISEVLQSLEPGDDVKKEGLMVVPSARIHGFVSAL